jgi:hypothetical protein
MNTRETVALTLLIASEWLTDEGDRLVLIETAANVRNQADISVTCPICDEIVCDDGCPLAETRAALA